MHENRTTYPKKKAQMYQQLQELPKKYKVLALVRMEKVRGSQLLPLRKTLQGEVEIVSIKDKVAKLFKTLPPSVWSHNFWMEVGIHLYVQILRL